jgi:hydrogenase maturation protease
VSNLVLGLGNPILGDDGVGWRIADEVERRLGGLTGVEVERSSSGGLSLMERMVGYRRVVIADAIRSGGAAGDVLTFSLEDLADPGAGHTTSAHDATLQTALELGRAAGADLPRTIEVVAVEAPEAFTFSEALTPAVSAAVPRAADRVLEALRAPAET